MMVVGRSCSTFSLAKGETIGVEADKDFEPGSRGGASGSAWESEARRDGRGQQGEVTRIADWSSNSRDQSKEGGGDGVRRRERELRPFATAARRTSRKF